MIFYMINQEITVIYLDKYAKTLLPGPGNYTVEKFAKDNQGPKFGFGSDTKSKDYKNKTSPGPGNYDNKSYMGDGVPGYSIKGRRPDVRVLPGKDTPGPGVYDPSLGYTRTNGPMYGIGKTSKSKIANIYGHTPAPNSYKPESKFIKTQAAAWRMGSNKRPDQLSQILDTPGPGSYDPAASTKSGPSLRGKSKIWIKDSPGPGAYSPDTRVAKKGAPRFSMGTQKKKTIAARPLNHFPGPGTYYKSKPRTGPSFGFGSSKRMHVRSDDSPGPGSYKIPTKIRNLEGYALPKNKYSFV